MNDIPINLINQVLLEFESERVAIEHEFVFKEVVYEWKNYIFCPFMLTIFQSSPRKFGIQVVLLTYNF